MKRQSIFWGESVNFGIQWKFLFLQFLSTIMPGDKEIRNMKYGEIGIFPLCHQNQVILNKLRVFISGQCWRWNPPRISIWIILKILVQIPSCRHTWCISIILFCLCIHLIPSLISFKYFSFGRSLKILKLLIKSWNILIFLGRRLRSILISTQNQAIIMKFLLSYLPKYISRISYNLNSLILKEGIISKPFPTLFQYYITRLLTFFECFKFPHYQS
jgi:hypothetical protein